jgi:hypothetical protein
MALSFLIATHKPIYEHGFPHILLPHHDKLHLRVFLLSLSRVPLKMLHTLQLPIGMHFPTRVHQLLRWLPQTIPSAIEGSKPRCDSWIEEPQVNGSKLVVGHVQHFEHSHSGKR